MYNIAYEIDMTTCRLIDLYRIFPSEFSSLEELKQEIGIIIAERVEKKIRDYKELLI